MQILGTDFETAHGFHQIYSQDVVCSSACSCGIALGDTNTGELISTDVIKIRPDPFEMDEKCFNVHGLSLISLEKAPTFDYAYLYWMKPYLDETELLLAHNATFDMRVLVKSLKFYGLKVPNIKYTCTLEIARAVYPNMKHKLDILCHQFGIPLDHHNSKSDAMAAARLFIKFFKEERSFPVWNLRDL
jgi:DNA polymerase-3 subunit epsilon